MKKTYSRRELYALGECLGECVTRQECGRRIMGGGGGGGSSESNSPDTTNTDRRSALQDSVQLNDGSKTGNINVTTYAADAEVLRTLAGEIPDAVKAVTSAGADVMNRAGGAVVNMVKDSNAANTRSFDAVVSMGASAIDKLIDASVQTAATGNALASQAVTAFKPTENANADALKWGLIAAAGVVALKVLK